MSLAVPLLPHPANRSDAVRRIEASLERDARTNALLARFRLDADMSRLRVPNAGSARRSDRLWQHTCFELFLRPDPGEAYYEFNFSPSGAWAGYRFAARRRDRTSPVMPAPRIGFRAATVGGEMSASLTLASLRDPDSAAGLAAGLAAVIEESDGRRSYFALAHGGAAPDFHDPATFVLRLLAE